MILCGKGTKKSPIYTAQCYKFDIFMELEAKFSQITFEISYDLKK